MHQHQVLDQLGLFPIGLGLLEGGYRSGLIRKSLVVVCLGEVLFGRDVVFDFAVKETRF